MSDDDSYTWIEWAVQWDDERGLEVMKLWKLTADDDERARAIAAGSPHVKAVFRRTIIVGPWIEAT